jgi:hypothetical protein
MMPLYFGLDVFCQFEARVPKYSAVFSICIVYTVQSTEPEVIVAIWRINREVVHGQSAASRQAAPIKEYRIGWSGPPRRKVETLQEGER